MIRGSDGRITRVCYVLLRHKAANRVGPGCGPKPTRPGANGVVELSPFEFVDRLANLVPPRRWPLRTSAGNARTLRAGMGAIVTAPEAAATQIKSSAHTTPHGLPGPSSWPGWQGVSPAVPSVWRRHPIDRLHHGARADPEDPHAPRRTAGATTRLARLMRPPTRASSCRYMTTMMSMKRRPTSYP